MVEPISGAMRAAPEPERGRLDRGFARHAGGATSIEYALIAGLIFLSVVAAIRLYSSRMNTVYGRITSTMSQVD